jgi:hypothetical protein
MGVSGSLLRFLGAIGKYSVVAAQAILEAEAQVGPGNGGTKKDVATAYTVAAVHAGETIGVPEVQAAAAAVELAFGIASIFGRLGAQKPGVTIPVPPAPAAKQVAGPTFGSGFSPGL